MRSNTILPQAHGLLHVILLHTTNNDISCWTEQCMGMQAKAMQFPSKEDMHVHVKRDKLQCTCSSPSQTCLSKYKAIEVVVGKVEAFIH